MNTVQRSCVLLAFALGLCGAYLPVAAQDQTATAKVSTEPLSTEQVAVYRAVLEYYLKGEDTALNLADTTEAMEGSPFVDEACAKQFNLSKSPTPLVHKLPRNIAPNRRLILVDPDRQKTLVEENDPQKLIKRAIDDGEKSV